MPQLATHHRYAAAQFPRIYYAQFSDPIISSTAVECLPTRALSSTTRTSPPLAAAAVGAADRELLRVRGDGAAHDARADAREGDIAHLTAQFGRNSSFGAIVLTRCRFRRVRVGASRGTNSSARAPCRRRRPSPIIIYVVLFVELSNRDPAATYHTYESDSARVLVAVRIVLLIWFVWCVRGRR